MKQLNLLLPDSIQAFTIVTVTDNWDGTVTLSSRQFGTDSITSGMVDYSFAGKDGEPHA